ncbi:MAG: hypothetical protein ACRD82_16850 [Blastocatellia bacterium]
MPKTTTKQPVIAVERTENGKPKNGSKPALSRRKKHKPFDQMTLEELTLFGFQLAHEQHQQKLSEQEDDSVHA